MIDVVPVKDIQELLEWRTEVIQTVFGVQPSAELMMKNEDYYRLHVADGSHIPVKALYNGLDAGCGSLCLTEELPSPDNPSGRCAYLMNIYVRQPFREHGVGHVIVNHLIELARYKGCNKIYLETTPEGRPLYESIGFHDLPDMMKLG